MKSLLSSGTIEAPHPAYQATLLAAEAVIATLCGRAPLRIEQVSLAQGSISYALELDRWALRHNRALLEDVVMTFLAPQAALRLLELSGDLLPPATRPTVRGLLLSSLSEPEEQAVVEAYLCVLEARVAATLRLLWTEIQVVAAGLREAGVLDGEDVRHRIACAQGIRATLLN